MVITIQKYTRGKGILRRFPILDHKRDGFSLVELMVVIALIGIIAGFGTPALLSMKAKSSLRADARDIYSTFKHAQSEAVKRSESVCILLNTPTAGDYTVFLDNGAGTPANANNASKDTGEITLAVNRLRPGSSFAGVTFTGNPGFNARGLPLGGVNGVGSVEIHSSALKMKLSLSIAGFIKSTVL